MQENLHLQEIHKLNPIVLSIEMIGSVPDMETGYSISAKNEPRITRTTQINPRHPRYPRL